MSLLHYKHVTAEDLTPEELKNSNLPDSSLLSVWVELTSPAKRTYTAVHVADQSYLEIHEEKYRELLIEEIRNRNKQKTPLTKKIVNCFKDLSRLSEPIKSHILLSSDKKKDLNDFEKVQKILADKTHGAVLEDYKDRFDDVCNIIFLGNKLTKKEIANLVISYEKYFKDVKIPFASFYNVGKLIGKNPGIPSGKLQYN